jgi:hypothetical protein
MKYILIFMLLLAPAAMAWDIEYFGEEAREEERGCDEN